MKTKTLKKNRLFLKVIFLTSSLAAIYLSYQFIRENCYFPVSLVQVYGANHVNHDELENLLKPLVAHNFFSVDIDLIKDKINQYSWVEGVSIQRVWPHQVNIIITERQPLALWRNGNLLSTNGDLYNKEGYENFPDLPIFLAPEGTQQLMLQTYQDFGRELAKIHAKIKNLELTPFQLWKVTLDNGIQIHLGHKNNLTHISQFVKVYGKIIGDKAKDVQYVDLRYPNGIAVMWKDGSPKQLEK